VTDRWSDPGAILTGPNTNLTKPEAIISQGNVLLATWLYERRDPAGVWYSYAKLDAPELPVVPLPAVAATATVAPASIVISRQPLPTAIPSPRPAFTPETDGTPLPSSESNPNIGILVAVIPVVLLVSLLVKRNLR
jgi:hypothetical protein